MTRQRNAEQARANEVVGGYFIEGAHYRKQDLRRARMRFRAGSNADSSASASSTNSSKNSSDNIDAVIRALCAYQFTTAGSNSCTAALEFHENSRDPYYTFQFVGVLVVHDYVFYVFPKFVRANCGPEHTLVKPSAQARALMRLVVRVCDRYRYRYRKRTGSGTDDTGFSTRASRNNTNTAELYRALLADYVHDGAYRTQTRVRVRNGNGEIDWERTLDRVTPYFTQQGAPLYADYWTRDRAVDDEALVRRIQLAWVAYAAQQFNAAGLLEDVLGFPHMLCSASQEVPADIGTPSYIRTVLLRARNREFSTRNRSLINLLLLLVDDDYQRRLNSQHAVTHLGTAPFHTVWEDVCRVLFASADAGCDGDGFGNGMRGQSKPIWRLTEDGGETWNEIAAEHNQLTPDVVCAVSEPRGIVIIDAKYYTPYVEGRSAREQSARTIGGQPGTYDVVKEYFYQLIADAALRDIGPVLANAFMFPSPYVIADSSAENAAPAAACPMPEPACAIRGSVRFDALGQYELHRKDDDASDESTKSYERTRLLPIVCAQLNAVSAFHAYVDSNPNAPDDSATSDAEGVINHHEINEILDELIQYSRR